MQCKLEHNLTMEVYDVRVIEYAMMDRSSPDVRDSSGMVKTRSPGDVVSSSALRMFEVMAVRMNCDTSNWSRAVSL